jgi:hypothetical protein
MKSHIVALSVALACSGAFAQSKSKSSDDSMYVSVGYQSGQYTNTDLTNLSNANHLVISVGKNMSAN